VYCCGYKKSGGKKAYYLTGTTAQYFLPLVLGSELSLVETKNPSVPQWENRPKPSLEMSE
jgi:hypothetical protein